MTDRFTFGTALYHPHIDINNPQWLRSAVLFWDHIHTIVPSSIKQPYRNRDTQVLAAEGVLSSLPPDKHPDVLNDLEGRLLKHSETLLSPFGWYEKSSGEKAVLLHPDKLGYMLHDMMERELRERKPSELLHRMLGDWKKEDDGFLRVDPRFAQTYMSVLAAGLAEKTGVSPLSSEYRAFGDNLRSMMADLTSRRQRSNADGTLVQIAMENLVLDPAVPIDQLLRYKRAHAAELELLAVEFDKLSSQIKEAESPADLKNKAQRIYRRDVRPRLESLKKSLADQSIGSIFGGVTLAATASVGAAAPLSSVIGLTGSVLLGAGAFLTIGKFALDASLTHRKARRDSPFTYLADVQQQFQIPKHLVAI